MPELHIIDVSTPIPGEKRQVEVRWRDGEEVRIATSGIDPGTGGEDEETIRWYLEEYAEYPAYPAPSSIAVSAEEQLAADGKDLFRGLFSDPDAEAIWIQARDRLGDVRVEVEADPGEGAGLAWERLRDPVNNVAVALRAGSFVRTPQRAAEHPQIPEPSGAQLRVLLVISRPDGQGDVPFRSVASGLVRGGMEPMEGLSLDVLRPATFARLSEVLQSAKKAGLPYHVVHFDGHGTYLDAADSEIEVGASGVSLAGPLRSGQRGYLLFEDPSNVENVQLVDGHEFGQLLVNADVPVLVLNACRSAYAEAHNRPGDTGPEPSTDNLTGDAHGRIRAYGSLADEVANAGVPGVVAMRYNVYVETAVQFVADLYAHLLDGEPLGQAVTAARRTLAANPRRQIGAAPVELQDWVVPVVYEAAPLVLLRPPNGIVPATRIIDPEAAQKSGAELPSPPDAGFFGRDDTLLALDRAFDSRKVVLLHGLAGAGKSSTAAEFARWYQATGGIDDATPSEELILWSSFEHHRTADQAIGMVGDHFAQVLRRWGIDWAAIADPAQRRSIVLEILTEIPVLWVWDNVEQITGFPAGARSVWTQTEQERLAGLLRDLERQTKCKVLLTSRHREQSWLCDLPARVRLPPMPMRESLQLAAALAARRDSSLPPTNWRPLLRFAAGNPLTIKVVIGQALRENLTTSSHITAFVARLQAGEAQLEADEDVEFGRTRSLAASLDYGFTHAFTETERKQLAVLHLFRDTADVQVLCAMGDPGLAENAVTELSGLDRVKGTALLHRAADIGMLTSLGNGRFAIHPALPWYFSGLFTATFGQPDGPVARRASRAYAAAVGALSEYIVSEVESGQIPEAAELLPAEEGNLLQGLDYACANHLWDVVLCCTQGLKMLYGQTGRDSEWADLISRISEKFTSAASADSLRGQKDLQFIITYYKAQLAARNRDWPSATRLQADLVKLCRREASKAMKISADSLSSQEIGGITNLITSISDLGDFLLEQLNPDCVKCYKESLALSKRIKYSGGESRSAYRLGSAHLLVPGLRDLDKAGHWFNRSLSLRPESDQHGKAECHAALADVALQRFEDLRALLPAAGGPEEPEPKILQSLVDQLNDALGNYSDALDLVPVDDHHPRGAWEGQLGIIYNAAGESVNALIHYQRAIHHFDELQDGYLAGRIRYNAALMLAGESKPEALAYAKAALDNFRAVGRGADGMVGRAEGLIAELECIAE